MKFYSPLSFFYLLAGVPIILMYLLKKQHKEVKIPSTYLWEKALKDIKAHKPWQKLRKNMLLLLQLLITLCIVFFLSKPYVLSDGMDGLDLMIMLDKSASMQSTDVEKTRFDAAKEEITKLIDNLKPDTYVTLMTVENNSQIIAKTKDKAMLKRKLSEITVGNGTDHIEEAMKAAKAIRKDPYDKIIYYTDKEVNQMLPNMVVKKIGGEGKNIAVENIAHSIDQDGISVLTTVVNYSDETVTGDLILYADENIFDVKSITIKPNEKLNHYFRKIPIDVNVLKAEMDIEDDLEIDNTRYHTVHSNIPGKILLTSKQNIFLEKAVSINKNVTLYKSNEILEDVNGYDLYIYDGLLPKTLPKDGNIILFNPPKDNELIKVKEKGVGGRLKQKNDELFTSITLDFALNEVKELDTPKWATPILFCDDNPIILKGEKGNQKIVIVGFDLHHTDFPLKIDFPIFMQNLLEYSLNLNRQDEIDILSGNPIHIDILPKCEEVFIVSPNGEKVKIGPPFPLAPFIDTNETGVYKIEQSMNGKIAKNYFVSNIDTKKESPIDFQYKDVKDQGEETKGQMKAGKDLKSIFLWLALIILCIEWVVYHREC